jgi:drug/metabolite transporter (DMT)-like permease
MIVWRGAGLVTAFLFGLCALAVSKAEVREEMLLIAVFAAIGAAITFGIGWNVNKPLRRANVDEGKLHSLFFVAMEWWSLAFVGVAVYRLLGAAGGLKRGPSQEARVSSSMRLSYVSTNARRNWRGSRIAKRLRAFGMVRLRAE